MHEPDISPMVGHTFEVNFGDIIFQNTFDSDSRLTYKPIKGDIGRAQTVTYHSVEIQPNAYFQFGQEADKTTVSRFVDLAKQVVHGNITLPDNKFLILTGTIKLIE